MKRQNDANKTTLELSRAQKEEIVGGFIEWMDVPLRLSGQRGVVGGSGD